MEPYLYVDLDIGSCEPLIKDSPARQTRICGLYPG